MSNLLIIKCLNLNEFFFIYFSLEIISLKIVCPALRRDPDECREKLEIEN